ncbi:hypothetical protein Bpfe_011921 [Biomphalaria pfeifferi]|uniref:Uncharacterized protein n=1 Tax=Biomphalaria pfeifferi TaxID=112525 RepID=A0AAD8BPV8_BIOPF|nr:hypothetical protein Bpfe_011921 [Biomphalaria pfeifferi]
MAEDYYVLCGTKWIWIIMCYVGLYLLNVTIIKKLLEESAITSTPNITDNKFLSQSIGNYDKVNDKFQIRKKDKETKISPKESCDIETETDSTKYNIEKTQEHCDIGTQTVIPEPMITYKKKHRPLVGRISVSPDFPSTNRWVVKGLRGDMKDILSGFHKKKHSGYIEKVYHTYFSRRKLKDIRKVVNFPK